MKVQDAAKKDFRRAPTPLLDAFIPRAKGKVFYQRGKRKAAGRAGPRERTLAQEDAEHCGGLIFLREWSRKKKSEEAAGAEKLAKKTEVAQI